MKAIVLFCLTAAAVAMAAAKTYSLNLYDAAMVGNTELKAGQYKVSLVDQKAVITKGKFRTENNVKVATAEKKFNSTSVVVNREGGKIRIQEIHLGGTNTKLVFE